MSFERSKRRLLGWLAFVAPIPLPFSEILEWPLLLVYLAGVAWFLVRSARGAERWLPVWGMNLLGFLYLPVLGFDLLVLSHGQLVQPVVHLLLFVLLVKLFSMRDEKHKWHALLGSTFLFLTAMATSVHPIIVVYLVVFIAMALVTLTRFAFLHVLAGFGHDDDSPAMMPIGGLTAIAVGAALLVAVPLFVMLPRMRSPFILGSGVGTGTVIESTGFTDRVTLDSIGLARTNREVVMRLRYGGEPPDWHDFRFKAGAHQRYRDRAWEPIPELGRALTPRYRGGPFELADEVPRGLVDVFLRPRIGRRLAVPVDATEILVFTRELYVGPAGSISLERAPGSILQYRLGLANHTLSLGREPDAAPGEPNLDLTGVSPEVAELARSVAGDGTVRERARAIERHLIRDYEYTLDFLGRGSDQPLEDFLFRYKSGHCEYFASAMVLMLRSEGIPARLATGFLGAEYNPFEGYYIVRQLNAHAWVEAFVPGEGWRVFDPTPPAGRPSGAEAGIGALLSQAYDYMVFRWDRYVLTYGVYDQVQLLLGVREFLGELWSLLRPEPGPKAPAPEVLPATAESAAAQPPAAEPLSWWWTVLAALLLAAVLLVLYLRGSREPAGLAAYRRLRRGLLRLGLGEGEAAAPLALAVEARRRFPTAAEDVERVVGLYVSESFGGAELSAEQCREVAQAASAARRALARAS